MFAMKEKKELAAIKEVVSSTARGIHKRIDENRELLEILQKKVPEFLRENFWVVGWIKSQDHFLTSLEEVVDVRRDPLNIDRFPRPWPDQLASEAKAQKVSLVTYAQQVHQQVNANCFAYMLLEFEIASSNQGYEFTRGTVSDEIPLSTKEIIGNEVEFAKLRHISPTRPASEIERFIEACRGDGTSIQWTDEILGALAKQGIAVVNRLNT